MKLNKAKFSFALLFCLLIVATSWLLGGNLPPVRAVSMAVVAFFAICICLIPSLIGTPTRIGLLAKALLLGGIAYAAFQLVPSSEATFSEYPAATRERLCELMLGTAALFVASSLFSGRVILPWVFGLIALNGVLLTFFGLAQIISQTEKLFWFYELIHGGAPFGPFVNGNNAGGYLLISFSAASFFLARRVFQFGGNSEARSSGIRKEPFLSTTVKTIGGAFARMQTRELYVFAALGAISAGVFASLSRGAVVALVASVLVGWVFMFRRNWKVAVASVAVLVAGIGILFWTQQNEAVVANMQPLTDLESASKQRLEHWEDALELSQDHMPQGTGLGTYSVMYPPYQSTHFKRWFKHAENQYLETLVEMGVVGVSILLLVMLVTFVACFSLLGKPDSTTRAVGLTGIVCLVGQGVAGFFDFGLYQPANTLLMAAVIGAVLGQHNWYWSNSNLSADSKSPTLRKTIAWIMTLLVAAGTVWAAYEYSAVDARRAGRRFVERFDPASDREELDQYQSILEYATQVRPDDSQAHYHLALLHILQYRMAAVDEMLKPLDEQPTQPTADGKVISASPTNQVFVSNGRQDTEPSNTADPVEQSGDATEEPNETAADQEKLTPLNLDPSNVTAGFTVEDAWPRTTLLGLHRMAKMASIANPQALDELINSDPVSDHLTTAWQELNLAEQCCDKYWLTQLRLGQLSSLMEPAEELAKEPAEEPAEKGDKENEYLDEALNRCPNETSLMYVVGLMKHHSGHSDAAYKLWNRCLDMTREFDDPIINFCRFEVGIKAFFEQVLPAEPHFRIRIARKFFGSPEDLLLKKMLLNHTKTVLNKDAHDEAEYNYLMGEMERLSENYQVSAIYFKRALEMEKRRADWRVQYARCLISSNKFEEAISELKHSKMFHGDHLAAAERLLRMTKRLRLQAIRDGIGY